MRRCAITLWETSHGSQHALLGIKHAVAIAEQGLVRILEHIRTSVCTGRTNLFTAWRFEFPRQNKKKINKFKSNSRNPTRRTNRSRPLMGVVYLRRHIGLVWNNSSDINLIDVLLASATNGRVTWSGSFSPVTAYHFPLMSGAGVVER